MTTISAFTIPARLSRPAIVSRTADERRARVIQLYREWYRSAPAIVEMYTLPVSAAYVRHALRQKFEANRNVTDGRAVEVLLLKSRQDYQETMNVWKLPDHVMGILLKSGEDVPRKSFLQKFYEGRDEDQVRPAASGTV
ncbi:hypothetical protein CYLTODRAFT_427013 [Cylindrobasidium torrendii FP15055 ss-10]|uniref:Complex 1 LYR protein domain-containing protein n=1 Tax=Cylindrobasidium torrendii FP15055 ss-10 TaxID=1314674 RepID=A0A0D7AYI9_9AGAR|nr:hypothetical protein CYLTODRAFT_427013 [Cylindrobasidium torrendii FP15055 ss-10]